jgi:GTPase SAR1 family protein
METSAKTRHNIENVFLALTRQIYENMPDEMTTNEDGILNKKKRKNDKGSCC